MCSRQMGVMISPKELEVEKSKKELEVTLGGSSQDL